jgi:hypothetical protein
MERDDGYMMDETKIRFARFGLVLIQGSIWEMEVMIFRSEEALGARNAGTL